MYSSTHTERPIEKRAIKQFSVSYFLKSELTNICKSTYWRHGRTPPGTGQLLTSRDDCQRTVTWDEVVQTPQQTESLFRWAGQWCLIKLSFLWRPVNESLVSSAPSCVTMYVEPVEWIDRMVSFRMCSPQRASGKSAPNARNTEDCLVFGTEHSVSQNSSFWHDYVWFYF